MSSAARPSSGMSDKSLFLVRIGGHPHLSREPLVQRCQKKRLLPTARQRRRCILLPLGLSKMTWMACTPGKLHRQTGRLVSDVILVCGVDNKGLVFRGVEV